MSTLQSGDLTPERQRVLDFHLRGFTPREIALRLGVSTQRVYQQLQRLREEGHIEEEAS